MVATIIPTDIAGIVSGQLESPIEDVVAIHGALARKLYHATWQAPDGPLAVVIRFYQGSRCEEDARIEAAALRSLLNAGYPVPELILCEEHGHAQSAPFVVMSQLPGRTLSEVALEDPARFPYWIDQACALLTKLHTLRWYEGFDFFHPPMNVLEFAERQVKWWGIQAQKVGAAEAKLGFEWLRMNMYRARECNHISLVHRDFHPDNLISDGQHIIGIIDWGELTIADPAVDVAWSRMIMETEVSQQVGDSFNGVYQRRHPEVRATQHFWEVFSAAKRLTTMANLQRLAATDSNVRLPDPQTIEAVRSFMHQRLIEED